MSRITQFMSFPVIWLLSKAFLPVKIQNREGLARFQGGPLIIVANHISSYDSFLLRLVTTWKNLPIRFMGVTSFHRLHLRVLKGLGLIHLTYFVFGVFRIVLRAGIQKNLETARKIIRKGGIVLIYPEGSINSSGKLMRFHRGAATLALETGAPVLPISFLPPRDILIDPTVITVGEQVRIEPGMGVDAVTDLFYKTLDGMLAEARNAATARAATMPTSQMVPERVRA